MTASAPRRTTTVETLILPDCRLVGRSLGSLRLRRRYGVYPLAVHRRNQNIGRQLDDVVVRVGDTLLLEGAPDDIRRLAADVDLVDLNETTEKPFKRGRAPLVIAVLACIVVGSSFDIAPIQILAMLGAVALLVTRTITPEEAYNTVSASLLVLILAMLVVGEALDRSGAAQTVVDAISPTLATMSPLGVLFVLYLMTQILTELLSNNAVAVIVTPVAIALGHSLGLDPRPLVVAVMFAATLAFATPIGYQTNTMVYGPGGYKFYDFTRIGLPLNIVTGVVSCLLIPVFWPLVPDSQEEDASCPAPASLSTAAASWPPAPPPERSPRAWRCRPSRRPRRGRSLPTACSRATSIPPPGMIWTRDRPPVAGAGGGMPPPRASPIRCRLAPLIDAPRRATCGEAAARRTCRRPGHPLPRRLGRPLRRERHVGADQVGRFRTAPVAPFRAARLVRRHRRPGLRDRSEPTGHADLRHHREPPAGLLPAFRRHGLRRRPDDRPRRAGRRGTRLDATSSDRRAGARWRRCCRNSATASKCNLLDEHVRAFHAVVPTFVAWDDHEVSTTGRRRRTSAADGPLPEKSVPPLAGPPARAFHEMTPIRFRPGRARPRLSQGRLRPMLDVFFVDLRSYRGPNGPVLDSAARCCGTTSPGFRKKPSSFPPTFWKKRGKSPTSF